MYKLPFKIECELEEIETIMTALNMEQERQTAEGNNKNVELIAKAIHRVANFTTNDR